MGIINMGPPPGLVTHLAEAHGIRNFVETGTFLAGTAVWASGIFPNVWTIENAASLHEQAMRRYGKIPNIEFMLGPTVARLPEASAALDGPAIFWLDAHWSGGETYGEADQCPVLDEIRIVNASAYEHVVLIDDARLFTSPPPPPNDPAQWPDICAVLATLNGARYPRYTLLQDDVIVSVPEPVRESLLGYYGASAEAANHLRAQTRLERFALLSARRLRAALPARAPRRPGGP